MFAMFGFIEIFENIFGPEKQILPLAIRYRFIGPYNDIDNLPEKISLNNQMKGKLELTNTVLSVCRVEFEADGTGADRTDFTHGTLVCTTSVTY